MTPEYHHMDNDNCGFIVDTRGIFFEIFLLGMLLMRRGEYF